MFYLSYRQCVRGCFRRGSVTNLWHYVYKSLHLSRPQFILNIVNESELVDICGISSYKTLESWCSSMLIPCSIIFLLIKSPHPR